MGKSACFAQRGAVIPASDGQKPLFCPTGRVFCEFGTPKRLFLGYVRRVLRIRDTKKAVFGVRKASFAGSGHQKGCFWGTQGEFCGFGGAKAVGRQGEAGVGGGKQGWGTAAGVNAIRRLQRGRCGGLCGRPSSRPAVARFAQRRAVFPAVEGQNTRETCVTHGAAAAHYFLSRSFCIFVRYIVCSTGARASGRTQMLPAAQRNPRRGSRARRPQEAVQRNPPHAKP